MDPPLKECKQSLARTAFHVFTFLPEKLQYTSLYASSCFIFLEMNLAKGNENDAKFCLKKSKTCINFSFKLCFWNSWNGGYSVLLGILQIECIHERGRVQRGGGALQRIAILYPRENLNLNFSLLKGNADSIKPSRVDDVTQG